MHLFCALIAATTGCSLTDLDDLGSGAATGSTTGTDGAGGAAGAGGSGTGATGGAMGSGGAAGCVSDEYSTAAMLGGHCYRRVSEPQTWGVAAGQCVARYGETAHLATVTSQEELVVHGMLYPPRCSRPLTSSSDPCDTRAFIGAKLAAGGTLGVDPFEWITGEGWTWPNGGRAPWLTDEPNTEFLGLHTSGGFDGRPDDFALPFICEIP